MVAPLEFGLPRERVVLNGPPFPITLVENPVTQAVGTTPTLIFRGSGDRWAWQLVNSGPTSITVGFSAAVTTANGTPLPATSGVAQMSYAEDGEAVWHEVWAIASGAGATIYSFEEVKAP